MRTTCLPCPLALCLALTLAAAAPLAAATATTVDQVVYDHVGPTYRQSGAFGAPWGAHEGLLHGVPTSWDWAAGARPGYWMNHGTNQAITSWGQVYEWANGSPVKNVRIQLRNHRFYVFVNGQWTLAESSSEDIKASWWAENFSGSLGSADVRVESAANGGGISVTPKSNYNIHWWTSKWPRASLPAGYQAFFASCELRVIANTDHAVNLANAKYLAGVSADSYPTVTSTGSGPWPSLSISRHKFITPQWQSFTSYISDGKPTSVDQYRRNILSRALPPGVTGNAPVNQAPLVSAGPDRTVVQPNAASLAGIVTDDGLPAGSSLTASWTKLSGPGSVSFANAAAAATTATFTIAGTYVLRLTASDGSLNSSDEVQVIVNAPPPINSAPAVNAGNDTSVTLPDHALLVGTATDDGLPTNSALVLTWSTVSGPGTVTFTPANAATTSASFSAPGTYVARLTASDGSLTGSDAVTIVVAAATPTPPMANPPTSSSGGCGVGGLSAALIGLLICVTTHLRHLRSPTSYLYMRGDR